MGYSAVVHVSWGLLEMPNCYGHCSLTSRCQHIFNRTAFRANKIDRHLSPNASSTWQTMSCENSCACMLSVWCRDLYLHTEGWCYGHSLSQCSLLYSQQELKLPCTHLVSFHRQTELSQAVGHTDCVVAQMWCGWQTPACLLSNFGNFESTSCRISQHSVQCRLEADSI